MREIELAIGAGVEKAHKKYLKLSGGWWLQHAPEYFITTHVALEIFKSTGLNIYVDAPLKRIWEEIGDQRFRSVKNASIRPDVSVWNSEWSGLEACIEIKRTNDMALVLEDFRRLSSMVGKRFGFKSAYQQTYRSDLKNPDLYEVGFKRWAKEGNWEIVEQHKVSDRPDKSGFYWSWCLFRHKMSEVSTVK